MQQAVARNVPYNLESLLREDEGEKLTAYHDSLGFLTIGVGICVDDKVMGAGLLPEESNWIFYNRLNLVQKAAEKWFPWYATAIPARQAVICSMIFVLGLSKTLQFKKMNEAVSKGEWGEAAAELTNSVWHSQAPARVDRLAKQLKDGVWV